MKACLVPCVEPTCRGYEQGSSSRCRRASNIGLSCSINSSAKRTNTKIGRHINKEGVVQNETLIVFAFIVPIVFAETRLFVSNLHGVTISPYV